MTRKRMPFDPDPDMVRREFPGSQVMPGSEGGWVAVWKGGTYTGKSPESLMSKMRRGFTTPVPQEETAEASR